MANNKKSLYRLPKEGKIFGVCAGLAEFFDMDVTLMRVIFIIMAFATGGAVVFLYIILAIVLPVAGEDYNSVSEKVDKLGSDLRDNKIMFRTRNYIGLALVMIGLWLLLAQVFPQLFDIRWNYIWPSLLIFTGLMVIVRRGYDK